MSPLLAGRTLERLARLDLTARRAAAGPRGGERAGGAAGAGSIFREHRTYAPGDDPRYVDWNVFGRLGALQVKVFEREESLDVHLLVDASASMGRGPGTKLQTALRLAGMVGSVGLARGARVRLQALSAGDLAPRSFRGRGATAGFLRVLAGVRGGGREPLGSSLRAAFPRLQRRGFALLVTDFLDAGEQEASWRRAVDFLRHRGVELTALHVVAPEERRPAFSGPLRLVDSESRDELRMDVDEDLLVRYRERFERRLREVAAYVRTKDAQHVVVESGDAGDTALLGRLLRTGVLR